MSAIDATRRKSARPRLSGTVATLFVVLWSRDAHAQTNADVGARADALYAEANDDFAHRRYTQACVKYEHVLRLQDSLGTRMQLATCYEKIGKFASALVELEHVERVGSHRVSAEAHGSGKEEGGFRVRERIQALERRVPKLEIVVPPEVIGLVGLKITRNGSSLVAASWGKPIPVDMGAHEFQVTAIGRVPWVGIVNVDAEGETMVVDVGIPQPLGGAPEAKTTQYPQPIRIAGFVGIGVGGLGVGVGATLGAVALSKVAESKEGHCNAQDVCDDIGKPLRSEAITYGHAATAVLITSGVLLGTGLILVATSSSKTSTPERKTTLMIAPGSVIIRGAW